MRTRAITIPILLAAIGTTGAAAAQGATAYSRSFTVRLSGRVEVPKGAPHGGGTARISLTGTKVCWAFKLTGVKSPAAAHLHSGGAGVAGPIVVPLGGKYKSTGCTTASKALVAKIVAAPKKYYVNVHNAAYPGGAVRSQL